MINTMDQEKMDKYDINKEELKSILSDYQKDLDTRYNLHGDYLEDLYYTLSNLIKLKRYAGVESSIFNMPIKMICDEIMRTEFLRKY